ncbi:hypothetical protein GGF40_001894 [Coemansia sp. RSA 1286]|nr:hypothetical protein GGF40_001894 [Coemansia sp. RSA 1286]
MTGSCTLSHTLPTVYHAFPPSVQLYGGAATCSERAFFWSSTVLCYLLTFVRQQGRRNYSIVDRIWPLYPVVFLLQWQLQSERLTQQSVVIQALVYTWGLRLCFNSVRRGDYQWGAEDYRWKHVQGAFSRVFGRGLVGAVVWEIFNLGFIAVFQLALLYLIAVPARLVVLGQQPNSNGGEWDVTQAMLAVGMALALVGEAVADQQQFRFQQRKRAQGGDRVGFVHSGLWKYSRHPNVFCEGVFWALLSVFCMRASGVDFGVCENAWLWAGAAVLALLLSSSVRLTESISTSKYPAYKAYMVKTSRVVPMLARDNRDVVDIAHSFSFVRKQQ